MKTFVVFEGDDKNDNSHVTNFRKLSTAMHYAKKSRFNYVLVNEYDGEKDDTMSLYRNTHFEKNLIKSA